MGSVHTPSAWRPIVAFLLDDGFPNLIYLNLDR